MASSLWILFSTLSGPARFSKGAFVRSFPRSFGRSFFHSLAYSLVRSFVHSLVSNYFFSLTHSLVLSLHGKESLRNRLLPKLGCVKRNECQGLKLKFIEKMSNFKLYRAWWTFALIYGVVGEYPANLLLGVTLRWSSIPFMLQKPG